MNSNNNLGTPDLQDIDLDGDLDIVLTESDVSKVIWYENPGDNQFSLSNYHELPAAPMSLSSKYQTFGDLDNDGFDDLILNNFYYSDDLFWFQGLGAGEFAAPEEIDSDLDLKTFKTIDIDLDSDDDFLLIDQRSHKIVWLRNNSLIPGGTDINLNVQVQDSVLCFGDQSAFIHINPDSYLCDDYLISWSNPDLFGFILSELGAGTYVYTISNSLGTSITDSVVISTATKIVSQGEFSLPFFHVFYLTSIFLFQKHI